MARGEGGWRIAPAPEGRGMPEEPKPPPPHRQRWFWIFFPVLLAINWTALLMTRSAAQPRVKVPFSPYFLDQVVAGQVASISSRSGAIAETLDAPDAYAAAGRPMRRAAGDLSRVASRPKLSRR